MASPGELPNLIVIGAMKSGTSSLHYYLDLHPEVRMSRPKELNFFVDDEDLDFRGYLCDAGEARRLVSGNWWRGADWYASHFDPSAAVRGESSVAYSFPWHPGVPVRMRSLIPDAKLVYLVRDPVERMISHYLQLAEREPQSPAEALTRDGNPYLPPSLYASVLAPFVECFGRERIHVMRQSELMRARRATMSELFRFLGVDDRFWSEEMERMRNRSAERGRARMVAQRIKLSRVGMPLRRLPPGVRLRAERFLAARSHREPVPVIGRDTRLSLISRLEPEIAGLEALTGWDLAEWRQPDAGARSAG